MNIVRRIAVVSAGVVGLATPLAMVQVAHAAPGPVVISEIHYHAVVDDTDDFLELTNTGSDPVDVSGWSFSAGITVTLPAGSVISGGGRFVVSPSAARFVTLYGFAPGQDVAQRHTRADRVVRHGHRHFGHCWRPTLSCAQRVADGPEVVPHRRFRADQRQLKQWTSRASFGFRTCHVEVWGRRSGRAHAWSSEDTVDRTRWRSCMHFVTTILHTPPAVVTVLALLVCLLPPLRQRRVSSTRPSAPAAPS